MKTIHSRRKFARAAAVAAATSARRSQTMLIAVALALGAILLTLNAPLAHAGSGTVQASENPVVVPYDRVNKGIELTWSIADPPENMYMAVKENGKPVIQVPNTGSQPTGSMSLHVYYGRTYTVQLMQFWTPSWPDAGHTAEFPLSEPLTITAKRPDNPAVALIPPGVDFNIPPEQGPLGCLPECGFLGPQDPPELPGDRLP